MKQSYSLFSLLKTATLTVFLILLGAIVTNAQSTSSIGKHSSSAPRLGCIAGTWTGVVSTDWNLSANWDCGTMPDNTTNVVIPSGLTNYPVLDSISPEINDLTLQSGATLLLNNATLKIKGTITTLGGTINALDGKVECTGTSTQIIPASLFDANVVKDLAVSNVAGVTLAGEVRAMGSVSFGNVNNAVFTTGGFLVLASSDTATAMIADITNGGTNTGNSISGAVTVERYLSPKRAYRFLTSAVTTPGSIRANWMENTNNPSRWVNNNPVPGYGIHITGAGGDANGFDETSTNNASVFTFDNLNQTWGSLPNTSGQLLAGSAYRVFVRGSRSTDLSLNDAVASTTVVRATGSLLTGTVVYQPAGAGGTPGTPTLAPIVNAYNLIGNPYASPIDWLTVNRTNVSGNIAVFDATVSGSGGRGAYVSYNAILGTNSNPSSGIDNNIQSGEGFFVISTGTSPSLTFKETDKVSVQRSVFRTTAVQAAKFSLQLVLPEQLNTPNSADGLVAYFSDAYSSSIGEEDSYKLNNLDENIAILRNGTLLSIEGRKPVNIADTLPLKIWNLSQKKYYLRIKMSDFPAGVQAFLEDRYLNTSTSVDNNTGLVVPFNLTTDTVSVATDRFKITFKSSGALPVTLSNVKAYEKNKGVEIDWSAQSESNIEKYEVERSADAQQFASIGSVNAKNITATTLAYTLFDAAPNGGANYYRIKTIDKAVTVKYSEVMKVVVASAKSNISIVNNPVVGRSISLLFDHAEKGDYVVSLVNAAGAKVYSTTISYGGGTAKEQLDLKKSMAGGVYQLNLVNGGYSKIISVLIQ